MKKIKIVAKESIIGINDDNGLKALNGYVEEIFEVEDDYSNDRYIDMIIDRYPNNRFDNFKIVEL